MQAAFARLAEEGRATPGSWSTVLVQFSNRLREYHMEPHEIATVRRPPIVTLDGYRRGRQPALPAGK